MQTAYTVDTSDIIIPLTQLLGECYNTTDPHPLMLFEKVGNLALKATLGQIRQVPIYDVLIPLTIYQGRPQFNSIADYTIKLWARLVYFMTPIQDDLYRTCVTIISISAGDLRIVFEDISEDTTNDKPYQ